MSEQINTIPEEELLFEQYRLKSRFQSILIKAFRRLKLEKGITQKDIAQSLGVDPALISKRLKGETNLTIETISDLATAMEIEICPNAKSWSEIENDNKLEMQSNKYSVWSESLSNKFTLDEYKVEKSRCKNSSNIKDNVSLYSIKIPVVLAQPNLEQTGVSNSNTINIIQHQKNPWKTKEIECQN